MNLSLNLREPPVLMPYTSILCDSTLTFWCRLSAHQTAIGNEAYVT